MKMNGCGNDFIVIDNRDGMMEQFDLKQFVQKVCRPKTSIGADGVMLLQQSETADFAMRYFNADGSEGEMCGNGARCICKFAHLLGLVKETIRFETLDGLYQATMIDDRTVKVFFPPVSIDAITLHQQGDFGWGMETYHHAHVGVPHTVLFTSHLSSMEGAELARRGSAIRHALDRFPRGTNVNFVEVINRSNILVRTYERGVEAETLACGSGATASAIIAHVAGEADLPVYVQTPGGRLTIGGTRSNQMITDIYLQGDAVVVAKGELLPSAWE